ncbi:MAG: hypothetical protein IIZ78_20150 [Clostridiales bacterium]|nr:hypothetical protein [Clostridiales bacterium]
MKGMTVQLAVKTVTGYDPFGAPIETEELIDVEDVLVGQPTTDDVTNTIQLYGKKIEYVLGIPKGDTHNWTDAEVIIWGQRFRTIGYPQTGIQENIPLRWGQNVRVERYG